MSKTLWIMLCISLGLTGALHSKQCASSCKGCFSMGFSEDGHDLETPLIDLWDTEACVLESLNEPDVECQKKRKNHEENNDCDTCERIDN